MAKQTENQLAITSYGPMQELYLAARAAVDGQGSDLDRIRLREAIQAVEKDAIARPKLRNVIEQARDLYIDSSCDIDVDDDAIVYHNGDGGHWVEGWLWVPEDA